MIKNIILDVGGILFDDSKDNINRILNENSTDIYKKAFGSTFKNCLLGKMQVSEHIKQFQDTKDYEKIDYILSKENLKISYPLIKENFEYICELKNQGYHLYLLANITEDSYNYIRKTIDLDKIFMGGIYSYQENIIKPDSRIFELVIHKYNLLRKETLFFDDKLENVIAANNCGIKGFVFHSIDDIKNNLD